MKNENVAEGGMFDCCSTSFCRAESLRGGGGVQGWGCTCKAGACCPPAQDTTWISIINHQRSTLNVPYRMNKFTIVYITLCILLLIDARASNSNHLCRPSTIIESSSSTEYIISNILSQKIALSWSTRQENVFHVFIHFYTPCNAIAPSPTPSIPS